MQVRYAAGTKDVLDRFFNNKPLKKDDVIVEGGKMAAQYDAAAKDRNMEFESVSFFYLSQVFATLFHQIWAVNSGSELYTCSCISCTLCIVPGLGRRLFVTTYHALHRSCGSCACHTEVSAQLRYNADMMSCVAGMGEGEV